MFKAITQDSISRTSRSTYVRNAFYHETDALGFQTGTAGGPGLYSLLTGTMTHWSTAGAEIAPVFLLSTSLGLQFHLFRGSKQASAFGAGDARTLAWSQALYSQRADEWGSRVDSLVDAMGDTISETIFVALSLPEGDRIRRGYTRLLFVTCSSGGWQPSAMTPYSTQTLLTASDAAFAERPTARLSGDLGALMTTSNMGSFFDGPSVGSAHYGSSVIALNPLMFLDSSDPAALWFSGSTGEGKVSASQGAAFTGSAHGGGIAVAGLLQRLVGVEWHTESISTDLSFFCVAGAAEMMYSSNPTFLSGTSGKVWTMSGTNSPTTYVTKVGLYNEAQELLAVAALSRPVAKRVGQPLAFSVPISF